MIIASCASLHITIIMLPNIPYPKKYLIIHKTQTS